MVPPPLLERLNRIVASIGQGALSALSPEEDGTEAYRSGKWNPSAPTALSSPAAAIQPVPATSVPDHDSVYLSLRAGRVEYADADVTPATDVYALCGLYNTPSLTYQTSSYAASSDGAYQPAAAQPDGRAARQSALSRVLGRACSASPPV